ncbi:unnamed protein product [Rotaria sp. Silwood1]|nr:unnamed protein product [Rotaria sp. Silwood1]CAF3857002.1 unnamed protein product [Rotaria sp. Silwood1]CAF4973010.1 unnamed protein product [Rotaria sp. Silwood1]
MGNCMPGQALNQEDTKLVVDWGTGEREVSVSLNDTIKTIKKRLHYLTGYPVDEHFLMYDGGSLWQDNWVLGSYNLPSNAKITIRRNKTFGKPVIRLRSINGQSISNVNVQIHLNSAWNFSSVYPELAHTDGVSFVEWNNIQVHPNGQLIIKQKEQEINMTRRYPLIDDEHEYRMLFWEATTDHLSAFSLDHALCVPRSDFARVLNYLLKKMTFSSEDCDDMITYVLPHLDETDSELSKKNVIFRFLSPDEYTNMAQLHIRPMPDQVIRAFLLYGLSHDEGKLATMDELENEVKKVFPISHSLNSSGLSIHEWGSMFVQ